MERFFLFLKDFDLITMELKGKKVDVLEKNWVILMFKKISENAKDLNFEKFITCIEKIGAMYYDEKLIYHVKKAQ